MNLDKKMSDLVSLPLFTIKKTLTISNDQEPKMVNQHAK